jgi:hypothetical protein
MESLLNDDLGRLKSIGMTKMDELRDSKMGFLQFQLF